MSDKERVTKALQDAFLQYRPMYRIKGKTPSLEDRKSDLGIIDAPMKAIKELIGYGK